MHFFAKLSKSSKSRTTILLHSLLIVALSYVFGLYICKGIKKIGTIDEVGCF